MRCLHIDKDISLLQNFKKIWNWKEDRREEGLFLRYVNWISDS